MKLIILSIIFIHCYSSKIIFDEDLKFPDSFIVTGTLYIPAASLSVPFVNYFSKELGKSRIDLYNGKDKYLYTNEKIYNIVKSGNDAKNCFVYDNNSDKLMTFIPYYERAQFKYNGYKNTAKYNFVNVFRYNYTQGSRTSFNKFFVSRIMSAKDDYHPQLWEIDGITTIFRRHFDQYIIEYQTLIETSINSNIFDKLEQDCVPHKPETVSSWKTKNLQTYKYIQNINVNKYLNGRYHQNVIDDFKRLVSFDWREHGIITPVDDQAFCGSCWSFSSVGVAEFSYMLNYGKHIRLSKQQLLDCTWKYGNNGCHGGQELNVCMYITEFGLVSQHEYGSYISVTDKCGYKVNDPLMNPVIKMSSCGPVDSDIEAIKQALLIYGPISVSINSDCPGFLTYQGGIFEGKNCLTDLKSLVHIVILIGYGINENTNKNYWIIKNSWSQKWGNAGYGKVSMVHDAGISVAPIDIQKNTCSEKPMSQY
ncbi:hypothetical protein A3Q56_00935 [Intoshia linei]|uniref:Peptidase C1A papain C-terminal domain-containing protein n=1 Tax=Intoshia linei TaxID=1819745 RepID=A0A177BC99_9BILA|nr:hypothetical protein A3Q56_00935 [Intoshia linei]